MLDKVVAICKKQYYLFAICEGQKSENSYFSKFNSI